MALPKQVQKQSEAVQDLYKELKEEEVKETSVEETAENTPESEPNADSKVEEVAAESSGEHSEDNQDGEWQQKYKTLQGMYNAEVPQLRNQIAEQNGKLSQFEQLLATMNKQQAQQPKQPEPVKLITDKDVEEYGESIDMMRKVSKEETNNLIEEVKNLKAQIASMTNNTLPQVQQLNTKVTDTQEQMFWSQLSNLVPDWQTINENQNFQNWLLEVDPLSGMSRQSYLEDAQRKYDADRVATFFRSWSGLKGEGSAQQIKASNQNELAQQVAPKKGRSQGSVPPQKRTYTQADIAKFYDDVRKGKYKGRDEERANMERDIFAAQAEGRLT